MSTRKRGVVKSFGAQETKRFGFLAVEGQADVFFHFNNGRCYVESEGKALLSSARVTRDPRPGDVIYFYLDRQSERPKAASWGFADDYNTIARRIEERKAAA